MGVGSPAVSKQYDIYVLDKTEETKNERKCAWGSYKAYYANAIFVNEWVYICVCMCVRVYVLI